MTERVMSINAVPSFLATTFHASQVKVREAGRVITIVPVEDARNTRNYCCPFLGIATDSDLTVDKFLEWKREEREAEYEKELRP